MAESRNPSTSRQTEDSLVLFLRDRFDDGRLSFNEKTVRTLLELVEAYERTTRDQRQIIADLLGVSEQVK